MPWTSRYGYGTPLKAAPKAAERRSLLLTRLVLQRGLALAYLIAFIAVIHQFKPLLGEHGLLPVPRYVEQISFMIRPASSSGFPGILLLIFSAGWASSHLRPFRFFGEVRQLVSAATWFLWVIYLSYVNVGQIFTVSAGKMLLLEAGFLAIFLGCRKTTPPRLVILAVPVAVCSG